MSFSTIQFHPGPRLATIMLNRPPLNIINRQMLDELNNVWSEIEDIKSQVVVISGTGDRAFSGVRSPTDGLVPQQWGQGHRLVRARDSADADE